MEQSATTVNENLLKTLYIVYRDPALEVTRSHLTRNMINKKIKDPDQRESLIREAIDQKMLIMSRRIQMDKGGPNPIYYQLSKLGVDTIRPFVGDDDLEEHE